MIHFFYQDKSFIFFIALIICTVFSCQSASDKVAVDISRMTGEELSKEFCTKCHLYTGPELLPKEQWNTVLDRMALHLGLPGKSDPYKGKILEEVFMIQQAEVFAVEPAMPDSTWRRLVQFYIDAAPDSFPSPAREEILTNELFEESFPSIPLGGFPVVMLVQFDSLRNQLYLSDLNNQLLRLNSDFSEDEITAFLAPVVHLTTVDSLNLITTQIGFLENNDQKAGLLELTDQATISQRARVIIELIRPVYLDIGDLDGDQRPDLLVSSFGNLVGNLSWYSFQDGKYIQHILRDKPGSIQTRILDVDEDGDQDILALFGQALEGVSLFRNHGRGIFQEEKLLEFNPLFGCSDFEVTDFDYDGDLDIILANGDNGDYSMIPKPYHGVRIFENLGEWNLSEKEFIAIPGATGVECADFDLDHDQDILVNCFYPDFQRLDESLLYLENQNNRSFIRRKFNLTSQGRWLVSDIGDLDQDGDLDIFVGSFALGPGHIPDSIARVWRSGENHLLYLENQSK